MRSRSIGWRGHPRTDSMTDDRFGVLVRLFFSRFFDKESLSPQGDPTANVIQTLGILAAPGGIVSILMFILPIWLPRTGWLLVFVRCLFLAFSMSVIGFIVVFEWDALFPDLRDYQVLFPLPVPVWKLFLAKITAFLVFLGMFLVAINGLVAIFWPFFFDEGNFLAVMGTHLLVVTAAGLFSAFAAASIHGLLLVLVPAKLFRSVVTCAQTVLMAAMVMLFLLSPLIADETRLIVGAPSGIARWMPAYLFSGVYEWMRPAVQSQALLDLGRTALAALGWAAALFALTHIPIYLRQARKLLDPPPFRPSGPGTFHVALNAALDRFLLRNPIQEAVFHYIGKTIVRSMKHRVLLAVIAGFGAALVIISLVPFVVVDHSSFSVQFNRGPAGAALMGVPLTLSFVLVSGLRAAFNFPAELTGNWSFRMTGAKQTGQCLIAMQKWILVCGVIPLFLLLTPFNLLFFPWPVALFQLVYGVVLSVFLMEVFFLDFARIPFTCGYFPGRNNLVWLLSAYVIGLIYYPSLMADLEIRLLASPLKAIAAVVIGCLILWKWRERAKPEESLDYLGDDDPAVRTLGLLQ